MPAAKIPKFPAQRELSRGKKKREKEEKERKKKREREKRTSDNKEIFTCIKIPVPSIQYMDTNYYFYEICRRTSHRWASAMRYVAHCERLPPVQAL